ncbi:MAG TPA: dTDP-4-dehydrorhamnose reductase [Stellaceae bacterium]|jgi:dTDP-4-dehydrorhamnose reductase|nr:dTDP-4-dehydrorhamnose reductase [Stellaceae bacterium]
MKILLCGAGGQIGTELCRLAPRNGWDLIATDRPVLDIGDRAAVDSAIHREQPDIILNAAAYTAVDRAESEPAEAWVGNCDGPANLAAGCRAAGIRLLHISTDYVFDGSKKGPYVETDPVNPLGVYGQSKEAGERAVREALAEHVILRTAWLYSAHGQNFVKTMLRLADARPLLRVIADQRGSPTSAAGIAAAIATIVARIASGAALWGTYHFAGSGEVSWHGFAEAIFAAAEPWRGPPPTVEPIATSEYPLPARRPANSVLDCRRIGADYGIVPRPWREALGDVVRELYEGPAAAG